MFMFLYSLVNVITIFSVSTATAYFICFVTKKPFINPEYSSDMVKNRLKNMIINISGVLLPSGFILSIIHDKILDSRLHNHLETFGTLVLFVLITEGTYYSYHRFVHRFSYYISIHKKHHTVTRIYPFDTFHVAYLDELSLMFSLATPYLFLELTFFEIYMSLWVYITCAYLVHSKDFSKIHYYHHMYFNCNYCVLFPIYDMAFGTYRASKPKETTVTE